MGLCSYIAKMKNTQRHTVSIFLYPRKNVTQKRTFKILLFMARKQNLYSLTLLELNFNK